MKSRFSLVALVCAAPLLLGSCLGVRPQLIDEDLTIDSAVVWAGEILVRGVVTVKKSGSLTLLPGTRIRFERFDRDGDGIGDGEIMVEGELTAVGTEAAPIVLTSAEPNPQPADWKYLYLDFARKGEVAHLLSEYAYSGIQIHFCAARVVDSVFRYNVDGVRFSTVKLELSGNRIYENTHGLRYEERRGTAQIHHNDIRDNEIGIFVVTRAEDRTVIEQNNIVGSRRYAVKMGLNQHADISLPRNWWGTTDPALIAASIFDRRSDRALGRVHTPEPLGAEVALHPEGR
ncbi:MAG: NosD domain-containing protein [Desulfuromonadales bacterium]|nr:NosD domain-containing protein [Desulfuromonadales bacterium]